MNNRLGLGFSSVESLSSSGQSWKEKFGKIGLFLCVMIVVGVFFIYITNATHQIDSHAAPANGSGPGWDQTTD
jgi:hypothetical protein